MHELPLNIPFYFLWLATSDHDEATKGQKSCIVIAQYACILELNLDSVTVALHQNDFVTAHWTHRREILLH